MGDGTKPEVIISEVGASEQDVSSIRTEMTQQASGGGTGGGAIDRAPFNERFALLEKSGIYTQRFGSTTRCIRTVEVPIQGGTTARFHCSRPCVSVGDSTYCPDHDRAMLQPIQTPVPKGRVTNSASIPLTKGEEDEIAKISKRGLEQQHAKGHAAQSAPAPMTPLAAPVDNANKVCISFSLEELAGKDVLKLFQNRMSEALDGLPCANVRQMKQVVALQSKLAKLGKARGKYKTASDVPEGESYA